MFVIKATFRNRKRPYYLNSNRSGWAWAAKKTAERFPTEQDAANRIACPSFPRSIEAELTIEQVR